MHSHSHNHLNLSALLLFSFALLEATAGWYSGSLALLSDAGHMATDVLSLVLAALAQKYMQRPATHKKSYGHGRLEVMAALVNGIFNIAVVIPIVVEAVDRLHHPEQVNGLVVSAVSLVALIVTTGCAVLLTRGERNLNTRAALLHLLGDILGSFGALIAGCVILFTGWTPIDPILSIFISFLIVLSTVHLLKETFHILMEGVPRHLSLEEVGATLRQCQGVQEIHDLHIWALSSGVIMLTAHIVMENVDAWETTLADCQNTLETEYQINHITLQPEQADQQSCLHCNSH